MIILLYKKGEHRQYDNYRAICPARVSFKLYAEILEKRIREQVEESLEEIQTAFRPGRQTNDNILR